MWSFASIDHLILKQRLARVLRCERTLGLTAAIIDGSNPQPEAVAYFPGDDLFTPYERRRGLPLGNQTSQFFANVYLDAVDQLVNRQLQAKVYARYVDDLVIFDDSKQRLREIRAAIEEQLWALRLELHPGKSRIHKVSDGVTFLGWRIFPGRARLVRPNVCRFRRRMRAMQAAFGQGVATFDEIEQRIQAWQAHAAHGDTWKLRGQLLQEFPFVLGEEGERRRAI